MSTQALQPASYTGQSGGLKKPSAWLASEDIGLNVEQPAQVQDVELHRNVKFDKGRTEEKVGALKFADIEKRMILNATNRKTMIRLFGTDTKAWRNQWVTLYVDPKCKNPEGGAPIPGLRLKEYVAPPTEKPSRPMDELVAAGDIMAAQGMTVYGDWFTKSLTAKERVMLKEKHQGWKDIAAK